MPIGHRADAAALCGLYPVDDDSSRPTVHKVVAMADPEVAAGSRAVPVAVEYLLEVRQRQLSEKLSDASRFGDREWSRRLRAEIDLVSRILQALRTERDRATPPSLHNHPT